MKAKLEQIAKPGHTHFFTYYKLEVPNFPFVWHYHPEYELTYIIKGKGKRLVGDSYEQFEHPDLALLGPSLPHTWVSSADFEGDCQAVVIQFSSEFIGPLLHHHEFNKIHNLLAKSANGLHFEPSLNQQSIALIQSMPGLQGAEAFATLILILQQLASSAHTELSSNHFKQFKRAGNQNKINKVFMYVENEFGNGISLQEAADMVHLSESAFCKFFKRISGKTFSDYVNDVRIARACQLLIETDAPIEQVAYETGFESQTYFNRVFLRKKQMKPKDFRKQGG